MTVDAEQAVQESIDAWSEGWPAADVGRIARLYAVEARFHSHPFRQGETAQSYVEGVFATQGRAECRFGMPIVSGDRAAVDWWGVIEDQDGSVETVAGRSLLRFDETGRVVEQRDAWGSAEGRVDAPHWA